MHVKEKESERMPYIIPSRTRRTCRSANMARELQRIATIRFTSSIFSIFVAALFSPPSAYAPPHLSFYATLLWWACNKIYKNKRAKSTAHTHTHIESSEELSTQRCFCSLTHWRRRQRMIQNSREEKEKIDGELIYVLPIEFCWSCETSSAVDNKRINRIFLLLSIEFHHFDHSQCKAIERNDTKDKATIDSAFLQHPYRQMEEKTREKC